MTTTATEHSPATARKAKAAATLQALKAEKETILSRQKSAQETIVQMNENIAKAERSGEADTLRELRDNRRAAEETVRDLTGALPGLDREILTAEGEVIMAERAVAAEQYNQAQVEQVSLCQTIEDALHTIADALDQKEKLAVRQQTLVAQVCPGADRNPALIRHDLAYAITARLQGNPPTALRTVDWSTLSMTAQGELR